MNPSILQRLAAAWGGLRRGPGREAYDGGRVTRTDAGFQPPKIGPNLEADLTLDMLQRRTRWLASSHPLIRNARAIIVNNVAGTTGIMLQPATRWPSLNKLIAERWWAHCEGVDEDRSMSDAQSQRQAMFELIDAGDVLLHRTVASAWNDHPAETAISCLPSEQMPLWKNSGGPGYLTDENVPAGAIVRHGVELRGRRRTAYHVLPQHPSDGGMVSVIPTTQRIDGRDATLLSVRDRASMVRGVPMFVAAVRTTWYEDGYHEANQQLALAAASVGLVIEGLTDPRKLMDKSQWFKDAKGDPILKIRPGMIGALPTGATMKVVAPNVPGPQYGEVAKLMAQRMAAAGHVGYSDVTRDYGDATFSSERARQLSNRKGYAPLQEMLDLGYCRPHYRDWLRLEIALGRIDLNAEQRRAYETDPRTLFKVEPIYPGWEWVNPQQEAQASQIELSLGATSLQAICAAKGRHWEDVQDQRIKEIVRWNTLCEANKLPPGTLPGEPVSGAAPAAPADPSVDPSGDPAGGSGGDAGNVNGFGGRLGALNGVATNGVGGHHA